MGSSLTLGGIAHDSDAMPSALAYSWSAPAGVISVASAQNPTFKCTGPGTVVISLSVSDGDAAPGCADTQTVSVTCSPATSSQTPYLVPLATGVGVQTKATRSSPRAASTWRSTTLRRCKQHGLIAAPPGLRPEA